MKKGRDMRMSLPAETVLRACIPLLAALFGIGLAGCATTGTPDEDMFTDCADAGDLPGLGGIKCATLTVPLNPAAADDEEVISLFVRKFPAEEPKATLWAIAGGPGESGASLYPVIETLRRAFPDHDILVPDHRGTGFSGHICIAEEAPDSAGGIALEGAEWGTCFGGIAGNPDRIRSFTISNAARDLHHLIGEIDTVGPDDIYAVSYGTQLVLRAQYLEPLPVRRVVLDSLVPPQDDERWDLSRRSKIVDQVGREVLDLCAEDANCSAIAGGNPEAGYQKLLADIEARPEAYPMIPEGQAKTFFGGLLNHPRARDWLFAIIGQSQNGDTAGLEAVENELAALTAEFSAYPQSPLSIPLVTGISASENTLRPDLTREELLAEEAGYLFTSPLPSLLVEPRLPLYEQDTAFARTPSVLPPTLILQGTLDPKTPIEGAVEHRQRLEDAGETGLVSIIGAPHFILWVAPDCFVDAVTSFAKNGVHDGDCSI